MRYRGVPDNIAELSQLVAEGENFTQMIGSFIDYNKNLVKKGRALEAANNFKPTPPLLSGVVEQGDVDDCFLAAMTEKLFKDWELGIPPEWIEDPCRYLNRPHYTIQTRYVDFLEKLRQISPEPFRKRNLFYTERVLDRC